MSYYQRTQQRLSELDEKIHNLETEVANKERVITSDKEAITDLENRIRELEVDVTVKERIRLEKEKVKIISRKMRVRMSEESRHEFIEQKCKDNSNQIKKKSSKKIINTRRSKPNFASQEPMKKYSSERYCLQAVKEITVDNGAIDGVIVKEHIKKYGGHFGKNDMMNAVYKPAMEDKIGKGFKLKSQDEIILKNGTFGTRRIQKTTPNNNANHTSEDEQFYEATDSQR
ncbi:hypothetical protein RhiirA4_456856 [Rhizophagus irregularis]|uniref:Uncharacterized protein n=1 Tax=Rhizophagus irregularis TaxID=588596 RepID=A0A2I1G8I9_9GLOM|nr:hypothetical protein RhiirA4_456856 [Rhizophagus irregularis]